MLRRNWELLLALTVALLTVLGMASWADAGDIPARAQQYRSTLIRCARAEWGLNAPVATFAAQVHQESYWNPDARSPYADGLAQFTASTANWLPEVAPQVGEADPFNPGWALRALTAYDLHLWSRISAATDCDRMAKTLSAYNGGLGWLRRDERLAEAQGLDPAQWWDQVEAVNAGRAPWAIRENRAYPRRILLLLEPLYEGAGWGKGMCP
ncbi:transglycosylase SLT domain-containing protein [Pseudodesulfovibrio indicus]|uniref:Lysozyme n=1 Tax=Pseudodesulfovibrio indicus TaxID=1716143 RepID=A0A140D8X0_9BACT|nr:transglycosylase SLT domain-containing protein [Pseudodesulfovibrio indicus]AMK09637.1 lysozyme [Pseudodesulfovibrio indicus]TDT86414.1 transglycosylase-like protein with SLT domain [Pseudodesulfovibrio indicus]